MRWVHREYSVECKHKIMSGVAAMSSVVSHVQRFQHYEVVVVGALSVRASAETPPPPRVSYLAAWTLNQVEARILGLSANEFVNLSTRETNTSISPEECSGICTCNTNKRHGPPDVVDQILAGQSCWSIRHQHAVLSPLRMCPPCIFHVCNQAS